MYYDRQVAISAPTYSIGPVAFKSQEVILFLTILFEPSKGTCSESDSSKVCAIRFQGVNTSH